MLLTLQQQQQLLLLLQSEIAAACLLQILGHFVRRPSDYRMRLVPAAAPAQTQTLNPKP